MEINDPRHGFVPVSKKLVNDMLIFSSDYEGLTENSQLVRNPAILRVSSKKEEIINSTDSKSAKKWSPIYALRLTHRLYRMFQTKFWLQWKLMHQMSKQMDKV
ncbi:hypothetical protein TNIN_494421 [Trichonephila inaurata madagascariensis]|uniref:Uncharacterized protein n=1 Tax=Trichonephila inaurata madagascariensis TaxID=2747483 RepID=A0A8X7C3T7_9ARAC|nr:hypothetical protein TNIN_494421 [Trichonephila inaurata madagascariensis]